MRQAGKRVEMALVDCRKVMHTSLSDFNFAYSLARPRDIEYQGQVSLCLQNPERVRAPMRNPLRHIAGRHGSGNTVALRQFATQRQQPTTVGHGLYTFGDHVALERPGQPNYAGDDGKVIHIEQHVPHKALVNLELIQRQALEIGPERRKRS